MNDVREGLAPYGGDRSWIATCAVQVRDPLEHEYEKRAGSAGGIEDCKRPQPTPHRVSNTHTRRSTINERTNVFGGDRGGRERLHQRRVHDVGDHTLWGKERATVPPVVRGHQRLERAAQHLGINGGVGPVHLRFAGREAIRAKQLPEQRAECLVGEMCGGIASLKRAAGKQSAVEEWHTAELPRHHRAVAYRSVERAEEEWEQHARVVASAARHARVEAPGKERAIPIEPSFRLEKRQEHQSRHAEQGELRAVGREANGQRVG
jgi:hypothetical protein